MGRKKPQGRTASKAPFELAPPPSSSLRVAYVSGAASPFRQPKEALALAGISLAVALAAVRRRAHRNSCSSPRSPGPGPGCSAHSATGVGFLEREPPHGAGIVTADDDLGRWDILWISTLSDDLRRRLAVFTGTGVAVSSVVMVLQLSGVKVFDFAAPFASKRLSLTGLSGNPADLAMAAVLILPLLLVWHDKLRPRWFANALMVMLSLAALLTQTLTGIVSLLLLFACG